MYGIGQHGGTMTHDARKKLEEQQQEVHHTAHDGHFVNFPFASGCLFVLVFHNLLPFDL